MCVMDGKLYVTGIFSSIDGYRLKVLAAWNGHRWCSIDSAAIVVNGNIVCGAIDNKLAIAGSENDQRRFGEQPRLLDGD